MARLDKFKGKTSLKGTLVIILSSVIFAFTYLTTKLASREVSGEEIAFIRFLFGIVITLFMILLGKASISTERLGMLAIRGIFGGLAIIFLFLAVAHGSVTNAAVLNNTYPIFATIFAAIYLKEKLRWGSIIPLMTAFLGIILLIHPQVSGAKISDLYGLISGLCGGISVVFIRELRKSQNSWTVFFSLGLFGAVFAAVLAFPKWIWPTAEGWAFMLLSAATATVGQLLATWGYKYCTASTGSTVSMSAVLFSALLGVIFLDEWLHGIELAGVVLLLASSVYLVTKDNNQQIQNKGQKIYNS